MDRDENLLRAVDNGPLPDGEEQAPFGELFGYLIRTYRKQLGLIGTARLSEQIREHLEMQKKVLDVRTIRAQLTTDKEPRQPNRNVRKILTEFVVESLKGKVPGCDETWFQQPTLRALQSRIEQDTEKADFVRNDSDKKEVVIGLKIPARPKIVAKLKTELCYHFVSYRFALESGNTDKIAREVITFSQQGENIEFLMSFKFGATDVGPYRIFRGYAIPLGQSLMCIGVHANADEPDRDLDHDRGRSLFMYRNAFTEAREARFGILSTTRAERGFEPCAACILLFRVEAMLGDLEIDEFRQRVTIIRPLRQIIESDFSALDEKSRNYLKIFIDNRPRGTSEMDKEQARDKVLKIWYDRFEREMPAILRQVYYNDDVKAPFKANWRETVLLAN